MIENLINEMKKIYEIYDIDDTKFNKICSDAIKSTIIDDSVDINFQYYLQCKVYLDNYIIEEIKRGNEDYKIILSLANIYIIKKFINIRKINMDFIDIKYKNIEQAKRLEKYYDDLSDNIIDNLCQEYDSDISFNEQYVKQLNNRFKK